MQRNYLTIIKYWELKISKTNRTQMTFFSKIPKTPINYLRTLYSLTWPRIKPWPRYQMPLWTVCITTISQVLIVGKNKWTWTWTATWIMKTKVALYSRISKDNRTIIGSTTLSLPVGKLKHIRTQLIMRIVVKVNHRFPGNYLVLSREALMESLIKSFQVINLMKNSWTGLYLSELVKTFRQSSKLYHRNKKMKLSIRVFWHRN